MGFENVFLAIPYLTDHGDRQNSTNIQGESVPDCLSRLLRRSYTCNRKAGNAISLRSMLIRLRSCIYTQLTRKFFTIRNDGVVVKKEVYVWLLWHSCGLMQHSNRKIFSIDINTTDASVIPQILPYVKFHYCPQKRGAWIISDPIGFIWLPQLIS